MSKVETLGELFLASARAFPERPALAFKSGAFTYRALAELARTLGDQVRASAGDGPVLVVGSRRPVTYVAILAVLTSGHAYIPINPKHPAARLRLILEVARASLLLIERKHVADLGPLFGEIAATMPVIVLDDDASVNQTTGARPPAAARGPGASEGAGGAAPAYLMFTSGSTGAPKGCVHTHATMMATCVMSASWRGATNDVTPPVTLCTAPLFHVTGMVGSMNVPIFLGGTIVPLPRWDALAAARLIA
ncbi:MAG TPA: AMP-binding protein, partial [Polyangiaceae bacterium]|nr:AMP-binding protein [Polyangiaceae bacterium]